MSSIALPKYFLGQFFLLSILLFSCGDNDSCIDADDYGNIQREIISVKPSISEVCYDSIRPDSYRNNYENVLPIYTTRPPATGVAPTALVDCLTTQNLKGTYLTLPNSQLLVDGILTYTASNKGCTGLGSVAQAEDRKTCETICESDCVHKNTVLVADNKEVSEMPWKANTPRESDSSVGINTTSNSKIFVVATGEVSLKTNYEIERPPSLDLNLFAGGQKVQLEFSGNYGAFNTQSYYDLTIPTNTNIEKMQGLARRSLVFFKPSTANNDPIKLNKITNKIDPQLPQPIGRTITYASSNDGFINFKMIQTVNCKDAKIDVSIKKNESDIIYYKAFNLKLPSTYTTKNIPTYSGSTIEIEITNLTDSSKPGDCLIKMQTQNYADTEIPYSGIAQFKTSATSCKLFGRIINPRADIITPPPDPSATCGTSLACGPGILNEADKDRAFIVLKGKAFNNPGGAYKVKNVYIGLNTYADKDRKDLAGSRCRLQLNNLPKCKIESSSCEIAASDYSSNLPNACIGGEGQTGTIESGKAGNGGGGGGNVGGEQGRYDGSYNYGGGGKGGESYINPEFGGLYGDITESLVDKSKGAQPREINQGNNADVQGGNGRVVLWWGENGAKETYDSTNSVIIPVSPYNTIPTDTKILHYKIYGGGGGAGGNCDDKGGKGGNGDYFSGTLDFSNFSSSSTITLKIKVGSGGYSGKNCTTSPLNSSHSQNPDNTEKLKGGNGGKDSGSGAGGGAGGSASYISLIRSDETGDTSREDFLVIAGGGGGGGGAVDGTEGKSANNSETSMRSNELQSNANDYRLAVALEALPTMGSGFTSDYYEYDDFFTKTVPKSDDPSIPVDSLNSIDPSNKINVTSSYGVGFFVRKGQILRILPKSFDDTECNGDILMKITPRPAVLCLDDIREENFPNPNCTKNIIINSLGQSSTQGCASKSSCAVCNYLNPADPCPIIIQQNDYCNDVEKCAKVICPNAGTDVNPAVCNNPPLELPTGCVPTCRACELKRRGERQQHTKIDINSSICYHFENKLNISVHNFLNKYNLASVQVKKDLESSIDVIKDYDDVNRFGNFNNYKRSTLNSGFFEKKDLVFFDSGSVESFLIKNKNFKELDPIAFKDSSNNYIISDRNNIPPRDSEVVVKITTTPIQKQGGDLEVALCKENDVKNPTCSSIGANILTYFVKNDRVEAGSNPYKFNSFGILERGTGALTMESGGTGAGIVISDCLGSSPGDNFICYKTTEGDEESKKYRLIFRIKDADNNYSNNSGEYSIKLEKKDSGVSSSGGVVNGILQPIISNLDGIKDNPLTPANEFKPGIIRNFYKQLISNPLYRSVLTLTIVLALSFYGMGYLIGVNELKHSEVVKILLKIGFIYLFTSTSAGWSWFNKFFVELFKNATDYISFSVAETFDFENSTVLRQRISESNFGDRGILFKSVDAVIDLILSEAVQKKIMALLFSSIFGWLYFLILYYCLFTYVYAVANSMLLYITCQIITSILFVLGPIFFIFLMFKVTKDMFDNWLKALIGFSLQQIFLVMTLALFNSFVIGFLKLALGYRVCWTKILSLNLYINRVTLLNFWTVAGTNAPENISEDSPDESFGNYQNMPSIYLFLYLMIIVSLMKKFIELFTDLAVAIAGGLKASSIAADSAAIGKRIFSAASSVASKLFENTAGRVVSRIDDTLFDSGKIASERRRAERKQFTEDMKTRVDLNKEGDKAVSEHKKDPVEAMKLAGMSVDKQKETLRVVRQNAIKNYAESNGINPKDLDRITNASGLNYSGNNLIGMSIQAGRQGIFSGGSLVNSMNDKNIDIDPSFSKSEANSAMKKMSKVEQDQFIEAVNEGTIHVNKGKIENARKMPIKVVKAILDPKAAVVSASKSAWSIAKKPLSAIVKKPFRMAGIVDPSKKDQLRNEVIKNLEDSGKITANQKPLPGFLTEWARTDEEKFKIEEAVRAKTIQQQVNLPKLTSKSVVKDIEATQKLNNDNKSFNARANRAQTRASNLFSRGFETLAEKTDRAEKMYEKNFKKLDEEKLEKERKEKEKDPSNKTQKEKLLEALENKINKDQNFKKEEGMQKFNILEKARDSIEEKDRGSFKTFFLGGKQAEISAEAKDDMIANGMQKNLGFTKTEGIFGLGKPSEAKLNRYFNELIEKEASTKPELFGAIKQNRYEMNETRAKLNFIDDRDKKIDKLKKSFDDAKKIKQEYASSVDDYKESNSSGARLGMALGAKVVSPARFLVRNTNSLFTSVRDGAKYMATRGKGEKNYNKILLAPDTIYKQREKYKSGIKALKEFNNIQNPEKFVKNHQKTLREIRAEAPSLTSNLPSNLPSNLTSTNISN